jgi:hypothetical protein
MVSLLKQYNITDKVAWRDFLLHNHPDKGGNPDVFISVKSAYEKYGPVEKPRKMRQKKRILPPVPGTEHKFIRSYDIYIMTPEYEEYLRRTEGAFGAVRTTSALTAF